MDHFYRTTNARTMLARLAALKTAMPACMHGSAWRGDGQELLRNLADALPAWDALRVSPGPTPAAVTRCAGS
ncbi:MAG: hypothetical protein ACE15C_07875 [Phycisphaerae bacterium]